MSTWSEQTTQSVQSRVQSDVECLQTTLDKIEFCSHCVKWMQLEQHDKQKQARHADHWVLQLEKTYCVFTACHRKLSGEVIAGAPATYYDMIYIL